MNSKLGCLLIFICTWFACGLSCVASEKVDGVAVPENFVVQQVASDELASDIFSMTFDSNGQLVVSGPGYIKRFVDRNGDQVFDAAQVVSDRIKQGAQGLCFDKDRLFAVCDGGLQQFKLDEEGVAKGGPSRLFEITTGGEHHAHAIRLGPDRHWYLLAGNATKILPEYHNEINSPVKKPRAGFLMRMDYEFKKSQIVAHGFRNAYDFDFNRDGEIFVFDSDGERDVSMPWYRPTRLFNVRPGDDAGWVNASWKRPDYFFDMPEVVGDLGRGSPTGVCSYQHDHFPSEFENATFVADWTFGRIVVFKFDASKQKYDSGSNFAISNGEFGFNISDMAVAPDGSLFVAVGGRGTKGGVYRISYVGEPDQRLSANERQPNSSWARKRWVSPEGFPQLTFNNDKTVASNLSNIQRIQEVAYRRPLSQKQWLEAASKLSSDPRAARVALKGLSTSNPKLEKATVLGLRTFLNSEDPSLQAAALELLVGRRGLVEDWSEDECKILAGSLRMCLLDFESTKARLLLNIFRHLPRQFIALVDPHGLPMESKLLLDICKAKPKDLITLMAVLEDDAFLRPGVDQVSVFRMLQLSIGDCDPHPNSGLFSGHIANNLKFPFETNRDHLGHLFAERFSDGANFLFNDVNARFELMRLFGMLEISSEGLPDPALLSSSVDDIHWLACYNLCKSDESKFKRNLFVKGLLLDLVDKRIREGRDHDRNWFPHLTRLAKDLFANDRELAWMVAVSPNYGHADHAFLHDAMPVEAKEASSQVFAEKVLADLPNATVGQLKIAVDSPGNINKETLRKCMEIPHLSDQAILELAKEPQQKDRVAFRMGLGSLNATVCKNSLVAIRRLSTKPVPEELIAAYNVSRRRGWDPQDVSIRDQALLLMQKQSGKTFGYKPKSNGVNQNEVLAKWASYLKASFPAKFALLVAANDEDFESRFSKVDWDTGDKARGEKAFVKFDCARCHGGGNRLGPQLQGVTKRFSKKDLFRSIVFPSEQVPARYRSTLLLTSDGKLRFGSVIYESVDGITLSESSGETIRLNKDSIVDRRTTRNSTMPSGLLRNSTPQDWADLYAWLKSQ